jgi:hypothetical protein
MLEGPFYRVKGAELTEQEALDLFDDLREQFEPQLTFAAADQTLSPGEAPERVDVETERYGVGYEFKADHNEDPADFGVTKLQDGDGDTLEFGTFNGERGWCWTRAFQHEVKPEKRRGKEWAVNCGSYTFTVLEVSR